ncbi:VAC8 [Acanthosepion pharaonis]|uniref:VAC8 n=1 Tax=Acanthosepion pharaonis TaxID=158019 RepID=A0A812B2C2_ACAPH|nr:VAC8 [Sepia pharaonis]
MGNVSDNEPSEIEKEALANLLYYLETEEELTIEFQQLIALRILIYSDNLELQQSAALCYLEISERMLDCPTTVILCPLIDLLRRKDDRVCRAATQALSNFLLRMPYCKTEMYPCQPIQPLIALLNSNNPDILCNTCACLTSLATSDTCRFEILAEDGLQLLLKMLYNNNVQVLRNAVGAIFNLTQMAESRDEIVRKGGIPLLIAVLRDCYDIDVRYYCFGAIGNIAITPENRQALLEDDDKLLINYLLVLNLSSESEKVVCQCLVALRNLASDSKLILLKW